MIRRAMICIIIRYTSLLSILIIIIMVVIIIDAIEDTSLAAYSHESRIKLLYRHLLWCALLYNQFNLLKEQDLLFYFYYYSKRSSKSPNNDHQQVFQLLISRERRNFGVRNFSPGTIPSEKIDVIVVCLSYYDAYQLCTSIQ